MLSKFIGTWRFSNNNLEDTGTFADGVFPLTIAEQHAAEKEQSLRSSYGRDYSTAAKLETAPPAYA